MKRMIIFSMLTGSINLLYAQKPDWQHLDLGTDSVFGISTKKAYTALLVNRKSKPVVVAVIDPEAVDIAHEDLKPVIWNNGQEIAGNGKDDDGDGFIDDMHGWTFGGSEKNSSLKNMSVAQKAFYDSLSYTKVPAAFKKEYQVYTRMLEDYRKQQSMASAMVQQISDFQAELDSLCKRIGKTNPGLEDVRQLQTKSQKEKSTQDIIIHLLENSHSLIDFQTKELKEALNYFKEQSIFRFDRQNGERPGISEFYERAEWVKKWLDFNNPFDIYAGHATHVGGIIAALRNNAIGVDGIADNTRVMCLQAIASGEEWDKAVAAAIRYATDKGASIINMSINLDHGGNANEKELDEAIAYAASRDVLLIHAAGNDGHELINTDKPYKNAWIEVGASGWKDDSTLVASFSNYGKTEVDVFAPGIQIYSTMPGNRYEKHGGTSMATPVVAGLAALIREYFPKLTAAEVKDIIMKSVVKRDILKDKCISGGVVNAYNALKLASIYK